ncbi:MAG: hypothetical protein A2W03_16350 [Candidatus Aminicenantes bacterium RBG_16_63_16]|nr:MAG: hypothetical protein A2W03_16350 [Candidatus Aminicenantes bacterium RBG_16_63_16]
MIDRKKAREYQFIPRVINPVKLRRAALFAADTRLRQSQNVLKESLPWLEIEVLSDPASVLQVSSDQPTVFLFDDTALGMLDAEAIRRRNQNAVLVLLTFQTFVQRSPRQLAGQKYPYTAGADLVFAVGREEFAPGSIIPYVVRAAEDLLNIEKFSRAPRFIFHVVDDEPRWVSQFLPVLYGIIGQRADVKITRTYEESLEFLFGVADEDGIDPSWYHLQGHGDDVVCLIADIFFPRGDELQSQAGLDLIRLVKTYYPRIPVIIASKAKEALEFKDLGFILPKGDPGSLQQLRDNILSLTGLGDFLVYGENGRELRRAKDIQGIYRILVEAEAETAAGRELRGILETYGEKDKFSTWLYMHSYRELGDRLRPRRGHGHQLITLLKRHLRLEIARIERMPLIIDGRKIFTLQDLQASLQTLAAEKIQPYSDDDIFSSWLDRKGYSELAEEFRPIHGSGPGLSQTLTEIVARWIKVYEERAVNSAPKKTPQIS